MIPSVNFPAPPAPSPDLAPIPAPRVADVMATAHAWYTDLAATTPEVQWWWAGTPDDDAEKRRTAVRVARQVVLAHSPIGRAAANVADLAAKLAEALHHFNAADVRGCVAAALGGAGLPDGEDEDAWQRDCFDVFAETARGHAYLVGQMEGVFRQTGGRLGEVAATGVRPVLSGATA